MTCQLSILSILLSSEMLFMVAARVAGVANVTTHDGMMFSASRCKCPSYKGIQGFRKIESLSLRQQSYFLAFTWLPYYNPYHQRLFYPFQGAWWLGSPSVKTPKVNLTKYVCVGEGQWRYCPVVIASNGRIKPDYVLVDGTREHHSEGAYSIDWYENGKRVRRSAGKNAVDAVAAQQRQGSLLAAKAFGLAVEPDDKPNKALLSVACADFLQETQHHRKNATYRQYEIALRYFEESCGSNKKLSDLTRKDLLEFVRYMREEKGLSNRTMWTKLNVPVQMLRQSGIKGLLTKRDWPRFLEQEPDAYGEDELKAFFAACNPFQRVLFQFFLMTGFREAEVQHVTWRDVYFKEGVVRVTAKPEFDFIPKTWEEREVPMSDALAAILEAHKSDATCALVFPTATTRQVNHHFLEMCKATALAAGLNCGTCDNGKSVCATAPVCNNWILHKFRATFATLNLRKGVDLATVQSWMGHKDLASTMRYLKPARGTGARERVNNTFSFVTPNGPEVRSESV